MNGWSHDQMTERSVVHKEGNTNPLLGPKCYVASNQAYYVI